MNKYGGLTAEEAAKRLMRLKDINNVLFSVKNFQRNLRKQSINRSNED